MKASYVKKKAYPVYQRMWRALVGASAAVRGPRPPGSPPGSPRLSLPLAPPPLCTEDSTCKQTNHDKLVPFKIEETNIPVR